MKIAIVTGIWQRPEVFRMFAQGVKVLQENSPHEIKCFVSGSEGETSKQLVESFGFSYIEILNDPLAKKMNASVLLAKEFGPDYILCVGSDDIISPGLLTAYERHMRSKIDFIGVTDFYFWDYAKNRASYWGGYKEAWRRGHTAGAGRMISKRLMDIWKWQPWNNEHNRILDTSIQEKLARTPHTTATFSMKSQGVFGLDIKSDTNMTPFKLWDNTELIDPEIIHKQFPYLKDLAKHRPIKIFSDDCKFFYRIHGLKFRVYEKTVYQGMGKMIECDVDSDWDEEQKAITHCELLNIENIGWNK